MNKTILWSGLLIITLMLICACQQTVVINPDKKPQIINDDVPPAEITPSQVRIIFNLQAEFPNGGISPDTVYMDGSALQENSMISTGMHTFVIEKRGYKNQTEQVIVKDTDGDGNFHLRSMLKTKERIIIFDIRNSTNDDVVSPDQVTMVPVPEGEAQSINDRAYVKPGRKKIVIQKQGYIPITRDITIDADEAPYVLNYKMTPKKS